MIFPVSRDTISLEGRGHAVIRVTRDAKGGYHVGELGTEGLFETAYGCFECRAEMNRQPGPHAAFWLQSPDLGKSGDPALGSFPDAVIFDYVRGCRRKAK